MPRRYLMPDVCRANGFSETLKIGHLAAAHGVAVSPHVVHEISLHVVGALQNGFLVEYMDWAPPDLFEEHARVPRRTLPHPRPPRPRHGARARRDREVPNANSGSGCTIRVARTCKRNCAPDPEFELTPCGTDRLAFVGAAAGGGLRSLAFVRRTLPLHAARLALTAGQQAGQREGEEPGTQAAPTATRVSHLTCGAKPLSRAAITHS